MTSVQIPTGEDPRPGWVSAEKGATFQQPVRRWWYWACHEGALSEMTLNSTDELKHAWDWFDAHAKQRLDTFNFYIVLQVAVLGGIGLAIKDGQFLFALVLSISLFAITIAFLCLERRVRDLIQIGEAALVVAEEKLSEETKNSALKLVEAADAAARRRPTYGNVFLGLFGFFLATSVFLAIVCLYNIGKPASLSDLLVLSGPEASAHGSNSKTFR